MDIDYDFYQRAPYSIFDLLGDIGGITNSLFLLGLFIMLLFQDKLFKSALIKEIYQVEDLNELQKKRDDDRNDDCENSDRFYIIEKGMRKVDNKRKDSEKRIRRSPLK